MSQEKKIPSPLTPQRLRNIALRYLERFASSKVNLERVLMRHVHKSNYHHQSDISEGERWISKLIDDLESGGFLNDTLYAEGKAAALFRRGNSISHIKMKLREKGLEGHIIDQAIDQIESEDVEYEAALNYAKRRRFGPFRSPDKREERKDKDMAAMARAGFGYELVRRIIEGNNNN